LAFAGMRASMPGVALVTPYAGMRCAPRIAFALPFASLPLPCAFIPHAVGLLRYMFALPLPHFATPRWLLPFVLVLSVLANAGRC